jgi:UDP-N-acetyl-D-galactosamine dehydrogenase
MHEYGVALTSWEKLPKAAAIVAAVAHRAFKSRALSDYLGKLAPNGVVADVKGQFDARALADHRVTVWRL